MRLDRHGRLLHVTEIRLAIFVQGGWHTDQDRIYFLQFLKIRSRTEMRAVHILLNFVLIDVLDIRFSSIQHAYFFGIGIKPGYAMPSFGKSQRERQAHIAASHNPYFKLCTFKKFWSSVGWHFVGKHS